MIPTKKSIKQRLRELYPRRPAFRRKIDYKALNTHILSITSQTCIDDLVSALSKSLKDILNYELFAFVTLDNRSLSIWSDPLLGKNGLLGIVEKDFPEADISSINYIAQEDPNIVSAYFKKPKAVQSHHLNVDSGRACLYLIHNTRNSEMNKEGSDILIRTFEATLYHILKVRELEKASAIDPLTGCYNRRAFKNELTHSISNAIRYKRALSLVMLDIDHFKSINDGYGHIFGDTVLKTFSETILSFIRKGDYLARFGGEEFVIVLPETPLKTAVDIAHRLQAKINSLVFQTPAMEPLKVTASYGISSLNEDDDMETLISEADTMLYLAKTSGRNCVMPQAANFEIKAVAM